MGYPAKVINFVQEDEVLEKIRCSEASAAVWKRAYEREHEIATAYRRTMCAAYRDKLDRWDRDARDRRDRVTLAWAAFATALAVGLLIARCL